MPTCPQCHAGYPSDVGVCPADGARLTDDAAQTIDTRDVAPRRDTPAPIA